MCAIHNVSIHTEHRRCVIINNCQVVVPVAVTRGVPAVSWQRSEVCVACIMMTLLLLVMMLHRLPSIATTTSKSQYLLLLYLLINKRNVSHVATSSSSSTLLVHIASSASKWQELRTHAVKPSAHTLTGLRMTTTFP